MKTRLGGLLACFFLLSTQAVSAQGVDVPDWTRLAQEPTWIKLGHYEPDSASASGWRSAIHSPEFFLSPTGRDNPRSELEATWSALRGPATTTDPDQHPRCRFPARWLWLKERFPGAMADVPPQRCPTFEQWTRGGAVDGLSVVYATGYLGNPASYYGHTLLKFNFRSDQRLTRLLDVSVNYGAIVGRDVDPVTYIFNSLTGGYDGGFSHIQFYFHNHNYGDIELRDLWEYRLDLPQAAVDRIVAHAWEVIGKRYTYHFFRLNCAYRMAELVQIADGVNLIPDATPWVIPQALIQKLGSVTREGKPLLADVIHYPSRQTRFYARHRDLSSTEAQVMAGVARGDASLQDTSFQNLPAESRKAVVDTLIDYYQFIASPLDKAAAPVREAYTRALAMRYQLPPGAPRAAMPVPESPHRGRPPGWTQVGIGHQTERGATLTLRYRPAYYDALDADAGHVGNSHLLMGDTQFIIQRDRVRLARFDLFAVDSVNAGETGLPGDKALAMKVRIGVEPLRLRCDTCLTPRLQADFGYGKQWSPGLFTAIYTGAALQRNGEQEGYGFARISMDIIARSAQGHGVLLSHQRRQPWDGGKSYGVSRAEARWPLGSNRDIRLHWDKDQVSRVTAAIGMYW